MKQRLKDLLSKYVIVPVNKAIGNVAFICQRFYAFVLVKELGLLNNNNITNQTYKQVSNSNINIINNQSNILKSKFDINLDDGNKQLFQMYYIPKLHKTPLEARFTVAAAHYFLKPISKAITSALKMLYKQIESYHTKSFFFSEVKTSGKSKIRKQYILPLIK